MIPSTITPSALEQWFKAPVSKLDALFGEARRLTERTFNRRIAIFKPGKQFPSISITGNQCHLQCRHCRGNFLKQMHALTSPNELLSFCQQLSQKGGTGCLISGGCRPDGTVPLLPFLPILTKIKTTTDLFLNVHTGFLTLAEAQQLAKTGIDCASIDVVGSDETIQSVYGLTQRSTHDYEMTLQALKTSRLHVAPHICVGLHHGRLLGELHALQLIHSVFQPSILVIIAFMPAQGTPMANEPPAQPEDIAKVCALARLIFPHSEIALGCMRPGGRLRKKTEELVIRAGVTRLVQPTNATLQYLQAHGFETKTSTSCCIM